MIRAVDLYDEGNVIDDAAVVLMQYDDDPRGSHYAIPADMVDVWLDMPNATVTRLDDDAAVARSARCGEIRIRSGVSTWVECRVERVQ